MTARDARQTNQALLDAAAQLVAEFSDVPAGSVLRSFSRSVRLARQAGCPVERLPEAAERLTREALVHRLPSVPRPRRG